MLEPIARIAIADLKESSGVVASRRFPGVFWTHNDSGDAARIFAFRRDGRAVVPPRTRAYHGVAVRGAVNRDWEDIATDDAGHLYLGDIGNNGNARRELAVYVVLEPDPETSLSTAPATRVPFVYPDQTEFPPQRPDFDAEALFWADGTLWLLTKHRSDTRTTLYRFDALRTDAPNVLRHVADFATDFPVSAADASRDGRRLAVLTDNSIWVFERGGAGESWFAGRQWHRRIEAGNAEGIAWDGEDLVLTNEAAGEVFVVSFKDLNPVTP